MCCLAAVDRPKKVTIQLFLKYGHKYDFLSIMVKSYTTDGRTHQFFVGLDLWQSFDIPRKFSRASLSNLSPGRLTHNL